jgi:ABC-2 type transport system permease protein
VELVFHTLNDLDHQGWILAAPVTAPAVASDVMITPGRAFPHAPPQWAGAAVMADYAVALTAAGIAVIRRRDVI